jgi:hypothetical protein
MSSDAVTIELKEFILHKIDSVAQLEALLLCRGNPTTEWTPDLVGKRLYISREQAQEVLSRLQSDGLLEVKPEEPTRYFYHPTSTDLKRRVDYLAEIYSKHLVPVTNVIHSKSKNRIQQFADAFKLRKEEP